MMAAGSNHELYEDWRRVRRILVMALAAVRALKHAILALESMLLDELTDWEVNRADQTVV